MKTFSIGYCYIISELVEAYIFLHSSLQNTIFYDCSGSSVILRDFSADFLDSMKDVQGIFVKEYAIHGERVMDRAINIVAQVLDHEIFFALGL